MRQFKNASDFYTSREWRKFRLGLMNERTAADGVLYCEHCGKPILKPSDCIAHHSKVEINSQNLNDVSVTLNPENIMLVHAICHNELHDRWGGRLKREQRKAYLVFGAPCSGKTTYVRNVMRKGDLKLDMDDLWASISGQPLHVKPKELNGIVFPIRDLILDKVMLRAGTWQQAWIISAEPYPSERKRLLEQLGGEPIYMDDSEEECLERLYSNPNGRDLDLYKGLIRTWFEERRKEEECF